MRMVVWELKVACDDGSVGSHKNFQLHWEKKRLAFECLT